MVLSHARRTAPGHAFGVANGDGTSKDLTLKLARDDAPIGGRIIDLEGRPVVGGKAHGPRHSRAGGWVA